jgi:hypothetical protein
MEVVDAFQKNNYFRSTFYVAIFDHPKLNKFLVTNAIFLGTTFNGEKTPCGYSAQSIKNGLPVWKAWVDKIQPDN